MGIRRFRFGKRNIEALEPDPNRRTHYYDTQVPGLELMVYPSGTKTFFSYRRLGREAIRVKIGRHPEVTPDQARKRATQLNAEIASGNDPRQPIRDARAELTLAEFFEIYLDRHARQRKKSWKEDERMFARYLMKLRSRQLSQIERRDVERIHSNIGKRAPYQANRVMALMRVIFNKASAWGYFSGDNPAKGIEKFREIPRERFLQEEEMESFFKAVAEEPNSAVRDVVFLLLQTGARISNVLSARWEDIHLDAKKPRWEIPETKSGYPVKIGLVEEAVELLRQRRIEVGDSPWVFPAQGKAKNRGSHMTDIKSGWTRILDRAGIEKLRLHDLRRTFGSWQAITGASLPVIGRSLGHRSPAMTQIYARLTEDPVQASRQRAFRAMRKAAGDLPEGEVVEFKVKKKP